MSSTTSKGEKTGSDALVIQQGQINPFNRSKLQRLLQISSDFKTNKPLSLLLSSFYKRKSAVHVALCDNIDTRTALEEMRMLVNQSNSYIAGRKGAKLKPNRMLVESIAIYLTNMLRVSAFSAAAAFRPPDSAHSLLNEQETRCVWLGNVYLCVLG